MWCSLYAISWSILSAEALCEAGAGDAPCLAYEPYESNVGGVEYGLINPREQMKNLGPKKVFDSPRYSSKNKEEEL